MFSMWSSFTSNVNKIRCVLCFVEKKKEPEVTRLCSRLDETNKLFAAVSRVLVLVGRRKRCMSFFEKACKKWRGRYEACINHVAIALETIKVCQHGDQRVTTTFRLWLRKKIAIWAFCILFSEREKLAFQKRKMKEKIGKNTAKPLVGFNWKFLVSSDSIWGDYCCYPVIKHTYIKSV